LNTFGKVSLVNTGLGRRWKIECAPHVMVRLKRVFERIDKKDIGVCFLDESVNNSRELAWFLQRFPMDVDPSDLLEKRVAEHRELEEKIFKILHEKYEAPHFDLALPPREYQRLAADMVLTTGRLLLADDVGLGKTVSAICTLTDPEALPALVVTLTHLPRQWEAEINKFAPKLRTHIVKKGTPYDLTVGKRGKRQLFPDVIIISYSKLKGWADVLLPVVRSVIYDECQELRHNTSLKYHAALKLSEASKYRMGLSATPIYNYGGEFFHVMQCIAVDSLGQWEEFQREWCTHSFGDKPRIGDPKAFGTFLRQEGLMLRRTRKDVQRELPALTIVPHYVDANLAALQKVQSSAAELARIILMQQGETRRGEKMQAAQELSWMLRQATGIAKAPYVAEFVKLMLEQDERVVLYGWHHEVYDLWRDLLRDHNPVFYTGEESIPQKEESKRKFISGETRLLVISLRAGAGLDGLQKVARTVVFGELDWSPGVHEQSLSEDTEILTRYGFSGRNNVDVGDEVAAFDIATGKISWELVTKKTGRTVDPGEQLYATITDKIDIRVTAGHQMVFRAKRRTISGTDRTDWGKTTAEDLAGQSRRFIPTSGFQEASGIGLSSYQLRLIGWFLTDGGRNGRGKSILTIYQADHQQWNKDIVEVLDGCGLKWTRHQRKPSVSGTVMNLYCVQKGTRKRKTSGSGNGWIELESYLDKDLSPLLENVTRSQLLDLLRGINMGDGSKRAKNVMRITNTNKVFLDRLQSLCVRRGLSANISERSARTKAGKLVYDIWISDSLEACVPRTGKSNAFRPVESKPGENVWCVTNRLGTLIARRNGKVAIVGNCIGRVYRDGQSEPVSAYYLISDHGSDPVVADVLQIKKQQIEGTRDPEAELIESLDTGEDNIKRLAERFLKITAN